MNIRAALEKKLDRIQLLFLDSLPEKVFAAEPKFHEELLAGLENITTVIRDGKITYPLKSCMDIVICTNSDAALHAYLTTLINQAIADKKLKQRYPQQKTLLMIAAENGFIAGVMMILEHTKINGSGKCDPSIMNATDNDGYTALMHVAKNRLALLQKGIDGIIIENILIDHGTDVEIKAKDGNVYLGLAVEAMAICTQAATPRLNKGAFILPRAKSNTQVNRVSLATSRDTLLSHPHKGSPSEEKQYPNP